MKQNNETVAKRVPFSNKYGIIEVGTPVSFRVENQSMWGGDIFGILAFDEDTQEYVIDCQRSGRLKTSGYLSVYWNTIIPLDGTRSTANTNEPPNATGDQEDLIISV